jgi:galactokinase
LAERVRAELSADFSSDKPIRITRAPGRLDVMGGIADYSGSLVCELPLERSTAVAIQERDDRQLQIFAFNLFDEHKPFTFRVPLAALVEQPIEMLRRDLSEPGRHWAAYVVGCLVALQHRDRAVERMTRGINVAIYSTVPSGAGVSSSAALEVATMVNLVAHLELNLEPVEIAKACQWAENHIAGAPCGLMDQMTSCLGQRGMLLRMVCQPSELKPMLKLPEGIRALGISSGRSHSIAGDAYRRTRVASFMGHRIIVEAMRTLAARSGRELIADPTGGYLANVDPDDYKRFFRPLVPEEMRGQAFVDAHGPIADTATQVDPATTYLIRHATDHHVLEARRVRRFVEFLEAAASKPVSERKLDLDRAGHLMYASHQSYGMDAFLGDENCDLLMDMVRRRKSLGFHGARISGGGCGGTVAVLANTGAKVDEAVGQVIEEYRQRTGLAAEAFLESGDGACGL